MKKRPNDFTWAHMLPDNAMILDNIGIRIRLTELSSWPKYQPWRDWYHNRSILARLRKLYLRIFRPQRLEYMRAQYEKWRFRYMQDLLNETLARGQEAIDAD